MHDPQQSSQHVAVAVVPLSPQRRVATLALVALAALILSALLFTLFGGAPGAKALPLESADVIVQFDANARVIRPIDFSEPISGIKALELSGLSIVISDTSFGPLVCSIEGVGCPSTNCFCGGAKYWGYNYWDGSAWQGYSTGAATSVISQTGAIEGWRWGEFGDAMASPVASQAAQSALDWIAGRQVITSGGFGSSAGGGVEVMLALGANHQSAADLRRTAESPSLEDFTAQTGAAYSRNSAGASGKLVTSLVAADACLPVGALTPSSHFSATLGTYAAGTGDNAWAILGSAAISESVPASALSQLRAAQQSDGGWEWSPGWGSDTNSSALAVQALVAQGEPLTSTVIVDALAYFSSTQQTDGGFPYAAGPTAASDANSTAYVIQALIAAGEDPEGAAWTQGANTPVSYLLTLQTASGAFEWTPGTGDNALATTQAVPALLGRSNPASFGALELCPATFLPAIQLGALAGDS